jgi:hypothetical protein
MSNRDLIVKEMTQIPAAVAELRGKPLTHRIDTGSRACRLPDGVELELHPRQRLEPLSVDLCRGLPNRGAEDSPRSTP